MRPTRQTQKESYEAKTWPPKKAAENGSQKSFLLQKKEGKTKHGRVLDRFLHPTFFDIFIMLPVSWLLWLLCIDPVLNCLDVLFFNCFYVEENWSFLAFVLGLFRGAGCSLIRPILDSCWV